MLKIYNIKSIQCKNGYSMQYKIMQYKNLEYKMYTIYKNIQYTI